MTLEPGQWKVRDLVMGQGTSYRVLASSNSFSLTVRAPQSRERPSAHGSLVGAEWANSKTMPIRVMIDAPPYTETAWLDAVDALTAAFQPVGASGEIVELYRNIDGREYVWLGRTRLVEPDTDLAAGGYGFVQCAFEAHDPRRYSAVESSLSVGLPVQTGGLTVPARAATTRLRLPGADGSYASTPDSSALDITGDLVLTAQADLASWASGTQRGLIGKWTFSADRSYLLAVDSDGTPRLFWSTDGVSSSTQPASSPVPATSGRLAVRVAFVPDDGAGGSTITFATAPDHTGPWTQLSTHTNAGTTSIHAGAGDLEVGAWDGGTMGPLDGVVEYAEVRSGGVTGTVVADPDFTVQAVGSTSFTDSSGNAWSVHGDARLVGGTYAGGLTVPLAVPGVLVGGRGQVTNSGTAAAPLTVRIDGPVVEPGFVLYSPDGSIQSVRFGLTLLAGQWLEIDSVKHTAFLNRAETANRRPDATWLLDDYPIQPGVTRVRFVSGAYSETAELTVTARSAWW